MAEELFDIVDENGNPTGETVSRSEAHAKGIMHRTAHIWVIRDNEGKKEVYKACLPPRDDRFCVPMGGLEMIRKYAAGSNRI